MKAKLSEAREFRLWPFWGRRLILFFGLFLFLRCSLNTPTSPSWNVKLTIPLVNKTYDMVTLIEKIDQSSLEVESSGNLLFHIQEDLDTTRLFGRLVCDSVTKNFKDTLGTIKIIPSESRQVVFWITDFYTGKPGIVPPSSASIEAVLDSFTSFYQVTIKEAYATLSASNHLGLDFDSLRFDIIDKVTWETLETVVIPGGIQDNDSIAQKLTFADETFSNRFAIRSTAHTPGGSLSSLEEKYLSLDFSLDSLTAAAGIAKIPSLRLTTSEEMILPSHHTIDSAKIRTGSLCLDLSNSTDVLVGIQISFPELKKDDRVLETSSAIPAGGHSKIELSLEGHSLKPASGGSINAQIQVQTGGSGEQLVLFSSADSVTANAFLSEIVFSQISGKLEPTMVDIGEIQRDLDLPPGFDRAHLSGANLNLDVYSGVNFPADLSLVIEGDGDQRIELSGSVEAGSPWAAALTTIQEDDLDPLLDPVPQELTVTGELICGDGVSSGVVNEEDFFFGTIEVSSPLELILDSCQVQIDQDSHTVNDDLRSLIQDQLNSGQVIVKIESHLPLDARVWILVSTNKENIFSDPELLLGPVNVPRGELDQNGLVIGSATSEAAISLSHEELQIFRNSPFYMAGKIDFPGTGGKMIRALGTDFIQIKSCLELEVKSKKEN